MNDDQGTKPASSDSVIELERAIEALCSGPAAPKDRARVRECLAAAVVEACDIPQSAASRGLPEILELATNASRGKRQAAELVIRTMAIDGVLDTSGGDNHLSRKIVALVESGVPDLCKFLRLADKRQTFEKVNVISGAHALICSNLEVLRELPPSLDEIDNLRHEVTKALRHAQCSAYLQPYGWTLLKGKLESICDQISELRSCQDATFNARFDRLKDSCVEVQALSGEAPSFLTTDYVSTFRNSVLASLEALRTGSIERFKCTIMHRRKAPNVAEKRYPLHQVDKLLAITIPMVNRGPGVAVDAVVELDCGKTNALALEVDEIRMGDIPPGEFAITFNALVVAPTTTIKMALQINWRQLFGEAVSTVFDVELVAQDPSIDWNYLDHLDPYSLEVAEGDAFVGRTAKVQAIGNRLLKTQMSSTYITGQKRIGKTSLARAVLEYVNARDVEHNFASTYLEYGEYSCADAAATVKALGEQLFAFLRGFLPPNVDLGKPDFSGSLAPLNSVARLLETTQPHRRFIVVLDEFDEIHPEMYRYGPLAEAFFANLRTLSARKNLAFLLVGGEKMPFIIGAQGDQLNKFVREPLDYFSRSGEWADYIELVTRPVRDALNWDEPAVNELFNLTNGHPYYTKLLCGRVFGVAVRERDTEIIASDVKHALRALVPELDTNAFAHFWKDGIEGDREQSEVLELKRLRVLVACGRGLRMGDHSVSAISEHISAGMQRNEVRPIVDDFCRRDVMTERDGLVAITLPIFQHWLEEIGVTKLIASTLADDLERELQRAEEEAFVKSGEIESVVKHWALYRGRAVTGENVRTWLDQVPDFQDQRLLFKLLANLRFVTTPQISEKLVHAHEALVIRLAPGRLRDSRSERRRDIWITYVDGPGKSGNQYARAYAKENSILVECVQEPSKLGKRLAISGRDSQPLPAAVVLVDDFVGTGRTLSAGLEAFLGEHGATLVTQKIPLAVIVLLSTQSGQMVVERALAKFPGLNAPLHVCDILSEEWYAFPQSGIGFWCDEHERDKAKALCIRLGTGLYKEPLGFGTQGLLLTFPDTCPNNALPILFASRSGANPWIPLFPRPSS